MFLKKKKWILAKILDDPHAASYGILNLEVGSSRLTPDKGKRTNSLGAQSFEILSLP